MKKDIKIACYFLGGEMEVFKFEPIEGKDEADIEIKALDVFFSPKRTMLYNNGQYYLKDKVVKLKVLMEDFQEKLDKEVKK